MLQCGPFLKTLLWIDNGYTVKCKCHLIDLDLLNFDTRVAAKVRLLWPNSLDGMGIEVSVYYMGQIKSMAEFSGKIVQTLDWSICHYTHNCFLFPGVPLSPLETLLTHSYWCSISGYMSICVLWISESVNLTLQFILTFVCSEDEVLLLRKTNLL